MIIFKLLSDGFIDEAHTLRDKYGADFVTLVASENVNYCGIAAVFSDSSSPYYAPGLAFPVYNIQCLYYGGGVWLHELSHTMGCYHDRFSQALSADDVTKGGKFYGYGHCWEDTSRTNCWCYKSVMAYSCRTVPNGCTGCGLKDYLANYNVMESGSPTGLKTASCGAYIDEYKYVPPTYRKSLNNSGILYSISPNYAFISSSSCVTINGWMINDISGEITSVTLSGVETVILSQSQHYVMVLTPNNITLPSVFVAGDVVVTATGNRVSILKSAFTFLPDGNPC